MPFELVIEWWEFAVSVVAVYATAMTALRLS